jgi:ATP-dependent RNA helicase DeaD
LAKKRDSKRNPRPRRPKRIVSGITEFIDDNWWEDSSRSRRDKPRKATSKPAAKKSADTDKESKPTKKAKTAKKKKATTQAKAPAAKPAPKAEPQAKPKRKRSHRRTAKSEPAAVPEVKQEPAAKKPAKKTAKKSTRTSAKAQEVKKPTAEKRVSEQPKSRRRRSTKKAVPEAPPEKTPASKATTEKPAEKPKRKRQRRKPDVKPEPQPKAKAKPEKKPAKEPAAKSNRKSLKTATKTTKADEIPREETPRKKQKKAAKPKKPVRETKEAPAKKKTTTAKKKPTKKRTRSRKGSGFGLMDLSDEMFEALELAGYSEPTPIQAGLIPEAIEGIDLMGQAQTGTGKTAAFAIPLLETIDYDNEFRGPQALVLVPTRELAVQVRDECAKLASTGEVQVVAVYGGKPIRRQIEKLRRAPEIVVGTPGRVIDLNARGALFFGDLRQVVLDEADRMLDIGFRPDIEKILRRCPQSRQTLLLSATLPGPVLRLAQRYMRDPKSLDFSPKNIAVETIDQYYFTVDPERKFDLLIKLIEREDPTQAIVFCRTRRGTEKIYRRLSKQNIDSVACIHGDLTQSTRDATMRKFRSGKLRVLVATDVVGRGIDVSGVSHIINYDIPEFCDDYVHRVGRTGRMGREGVAYSFISPEEGPQLTRIEVRINMLLKRAEMPGFDMGIKAVSDETGPPPESKPVYGRPKRRVRRAL